MVGVREIGLPDHDQPVCAAGNEVLAVAGEVEAVDSAPVACVKRANLGWRALESLVAGPTI